MQELFTLIHYNGALRTFNHYFDELVASYRLPTYPQHAAASKAISDESVNSRNWFSMGDLLVAIAMPSFGKTLEVQEWAFVDHDLATLSLALRAFHEAHGNYPTDLAALQPGLLAAIPSDGFTVRCCTTTVTVKGSCFTAWDPTGRTMAALIARMPRAGSLTLWLERPSDVRGAPCVALQHR